jgi:hypothetical protein
VNRSRTTVQAAKLAAGQAPTELTKQQIAEIEAFGTVD